MKTILNRDAIAICGVPAGVGLLGRDWTIPAVWLMPATALALRPLLAPWVFMWVLAVAIFAAFKWWTWRRIVNRGEPVSAGRSAAYLFAWPGMDAGRFLASRSPISEPALAAWAFAFAKTCFGAALVWCIARRAGNAWLAGWIGMIGTIFLLHCGTFHLFALFWQWCGIDAQPIMRWPVLAGSVADFWGKRWNVGFRDIAFGLFFTPLRRVMPPALATMGTFLLSGVLHELVITVPIGAAYGLPTGYFLLQGMALLFERSSLRMAFGLRKGIAGHFFVLAVVALPMFALFPKPFVLGVFIPFLKAIKALP